MAILEGIQSLVLKHALCLICLQLHLPYTSSSQAKKFKASKAKQQQGEAAALFVEAARGGIDGHGQPLLAKRAGPILRSMRGARPCRMQDGPPRPQLVRFSLTCGSWTADEWMALPLGDTNGQRTNARTDCSSTTRLLKHHIQNGFGHSEIS